MAPMDDTERREAIKRLSRYALDASALIDACDVLAGHMTPEDADAAAVRRASEHRRLLRKLGASDESEN